MKLKIETEISENGILTIITEGLTGLSQENVLGKDSQNRLSISTLYILNLSQNGRKRKQADKSSF
jgi:hypothetical protein